MQSEQAQMSTKEEKLPETVHVDKPFMKSSRVVKQTTTTKLDSKQ